MERHPRRMSRRATTYVSALISAGIAASGLERYCTKTRFALAQPKLRASDRTAIPHLKFSDFLQLIILKHHNIIWV